VIVKMDIMMMETSANNVYIRVKIVNLLMYVRPVKHQLIEKILQIVLVMIHTMIMIVNV